MDSKRVASILLSSVWGALRIGSAVIVLVLGGYFVWTVVTSKPWVTMERVPVDPMVCGKMSGVVYELPRSYVVFWPEYEGKSSWEVGFTENKTGCDANLVSLYMAMSLPELKPVSFHDATSFSFSGAKVGMQPWRYGEVGLRKKLKSYLKNTPENIVAQNTYDKTIGMNYVEGVHRIDLDRKQDFFWLEEKGHMKYVVYCIKGYWEEESLCDFNYLLPGADVVVSLRFLRSKLSDWRDVVSRVEGFLLSAVKKEENK